MNSNPNPSPIQRLSIANFLSRLEKDPMTAYREAEVIALTPNKELFGRMWLVPFLKDLDGLPNLPTLPYLRKTVVFERKKENRLSTFITASSFFHPSLATSLTRVLDPERMVFPGDGHLRWHTAAPSNGEHGKVYGFLTHDEHTLLINPIELKSVCLDMQIIRLPSSNYSLHLLTNSGAVFHSLISPRDIQELNEQHQDPIFRQIAEGANCLLTIPRRSESVPILGTDDGIKVYDNQIYGTEGMKVRKLAVNSEAARIFFRTDQGQIFTIPMDKDFTPKGKAPLLIGQTEVKDDEELLAGPYISINEKAALLLASWEKVSDARTKTSDFTYSRQLIELPVSVQ
jgi:hypothetical protein